MIKKAFGDDSMSEAQIKFWYRHFKNGQESFESDQRSGRPSTSRIPEYVERVRAAINENRRLTVRELEEDLGIPRTTVSQILTEDLGKKRVAAKFLVKHHITQVCQPPYSPDLAPCDFWLFLKLKLPLKGRRFQSAKEIKENATRQLMAIPKKDFSDCFEKWKERWDKCVRSQREYFEGD